MEYPEIVRTNQGELSTYQLTNGSDSWLPNATAKNNVSPGFLMYARVCAAIFVVCGTLGNLLTIVIILRTKKIRENANNVFVCNMSISDGLFCLLVLPFACLLLEPDVREFPLSGEFCHWLAFFKFAFTCMSLVSLCTIALNRYIYLIHPHWQSRIFSTRNVVFIIAISWIISVFLTILPIIRVWGSYSYDSRVHSCTFTPGESTSFRIFIVSLSLFVPFIFMAICYSRICVRVYRAKKQLNRWSSCNSQTSNRSAKNRRENLQLTTTMIVIFLLHLVSCLPYTCMGIADPRVRYPVIHVVTTTIAWLQFVLNPLVYTVTNDRFRKAYKNFLTNICTKSNSLKPLDTSAANSIRNCTRDDDALNLVVIAEGQNSHKLPYHETDL